MTDAAPSTDLQTVAEDQVIMAASDPVVAALLAYRKRPLPRNPKTWSKDSDWHSPANWKGAVLIANNLKLSDFPLCSPEAQKLIMACVKEEFADWSKAKRGHSEVMRAKETPTGGAPIRLTLSRGSSGWNDVNRYVVKRVCDAGSICSLVGPSGSYKTFWLLDLCAHVALGRTWKGHKVHRGPVLYCAAEGQRALKKRIKGYEERHDVNLDNIFVFPSGVNLADPAWQEAVINSLNEIEEITGEKPQMVIIDTFTRSLAGDELLQKDVMPFINGAQNINNQTGVCTWLTQHTAKQQEGKRGARGNGTIYDSLDFEMQVRKQDKGMIFCEQSKAKDSEFVPPFCIELLEIDLGIDKDGDHITTMTMGTEKIAPPEPEDKVERIREKQMAGAQVANDAKRRRTDGHMLAVLRQGGELKKSEWVSLGQNYCPEDPYSDPAGVGKTAAYDAIERLVACGAVAMIGEGRSCVYRPAEGPMGAAFELGDSLPY